MSATRRAAASWATGAAFVLAACGARTGLEVSDLGTPSPRVDEGLLANPSPDAGPQHDLCVELPYREPPSEVEVSFVTRIETADVFFLVDVTGSMGEEIDQIQDLLRVEIIPRLKDAIPDLHFGVGHFADFPLPEHNYGEEDDEVYRLVQPVTGSAASVQEAVDRLRLQGGRDGAEALTEALYQTATGDGLGRFVEPAGCSAGRPGYPCFRPIGARVILTFTDAPTHNGPGGRNPYAPGVITPAPHSYAEAVDALNAIGAKVLGIHSGARSSSGREDLESFATRTGAVLSDATPLVFDIERDGASLAQTVVQAVGSLVRDVPIDLDVVIEDMPGDAFDATAFLRGVETRGSDPPGAAVDLGDRYDQVLPGTEVTFAIVLRNDDIPQTETVQPFMLRVVLRGDGVSRLREVVVMEMIPPHAPTEPSCPQ
ncbi:MAG: vWA domain-containing protein [Sandaracinaceae bacterium]